jgi:hypothetical protein
MALYALGTSCGPVGLASSPGSLLVLTVLLSEITLGAFSEACLILAYPLRIPQLALLL